MEARKTDTRMQVRNRIIQGDCTAIMPWLDAESVDFIITDPPYLVRYRPRSGQRVLNDEPNRWVYPAYQEMYRLLKPNAFCVSFYGWPHVEVFMTAWKQAGFRPVGHLVFCKRYASKVGYVRGQHETAYLLVKGRPPPPKAPLSDVGQWDYTGNRWHPTQKPVSVIRPFIETYSRPGALVLDPFLGSGTTALAAQACGRAYLGIEQDARLCHAAEQRLQS